MNPCPIALVKCRERWPDFKAAGWTADDITGRDKYQHGYHGLAWHLRDHQDIGRIWHWCAELIGHQSGRDGERSRLYYWRSAPLATLLARYGREVVPDGVRV